MKLSDAIKVMQQLGERAGGDPELKVYEIAEDREVSYEITWGEGEVYLEIH
jgi:hypothetical protein